MVSECQIDYLIAGLDLMKAQGLAALVPREEAFAAYNRRMNAAVQRTVWFTGGCQSWYLDKDGIPNVYPWRPSRYRREMLNPDFSEFHQVKDPAGAAQQHASGQLVRRPPA